MPRPGRSLTRPVRCSRGLGSAPLRLLRPRPDHNRDLAIDEPLDPLRESPGETSWDVAGKRQLELAADPRQVSTTRFQQVSDTFQRGDKRLERVDAVTEPSPWGLQIADLEGASPATVRFGLGHSQTDDNRLSPT